jgi:hypothetical protein
MYLDGSGIFYDDPTRQVASVGARADKHSGDWRTDRDIDIWQAFFDR